MVPSEHSKSLSKSCSIIGQKPDFPNLSFFFHLFSSSQAIPVPSGHLELVCSQFFSAWVKDVQQGQRKTFSADEFMVVTERAFVV